MKKKFRLIIIPIILISIFVVLHVVGQVKWKETDYLSVGMIVLTYFYVVFTWEMLQRIETQNYLEKRPYIIADFYKERSEERRVGKECRYGWAPNHYRKKK